jgi:hypothetical protein
MPTRVDSSATPCRPPEVRVEQADGDLQARSCNPKLTRVLPDVGQWSAGSEF